MNPGTKVAASEAMRTSHAQASESPAPATGPLIAASTGFSSARIARMFGWYVPSSASRMPPGKLGELLQILAGAEAAAGTGDDDGAHLWVGRFGERLAQRGVERAVEGVEDLRPVERDREHCARPGGEHFGHGSRLDAWSGIGAQTGVAIHVFSRSRNARTASCASSPSIDIASQSRAWPTVWCQARSRQTFSCCFA